MIYTADEERTILQSSGVIELMPLDAIKELKTRYAEPHRVYHTWDHALSVLSWVNEVTAYSGITHRAMQLAALYHDAVYEKQGSPQNELDSCDLFCDHAVNQGWFREHVEELGEPLPARVCRYIQATARHGKLNTADVPTDVAMFLDCDMVSFAEPRWDLFVANDNRVRAELFGLHDVAKVEAGRKAFLSGLITERHVFQNGYFQRRYEDQAKANIRRLIEATP